MIKKLLIILLFWVFFVFSRRLKEKGIHEQRSDFVVQRKLLLNKDEDHTVIFGVQEKNLDLLEIHFWDVSNPKSENYGRHWTRQEICDLTANPESEKIIVEHLENNGEVSSIKKSPYGEYITATAPIRVWEDMFDTEFYGYAQVGGHRKEFVVRTPEYSLPDEIFDHVSVVFNTIQLPNNWGKNGFVNDFEGVLKNVNSQGVHERTTRRTSSTDPMTPALLRSYYSIPDGSETDGPLSSQAVLFTDQYFSSQDLGVFEQDNSLPSQSIYRVYGGHFSNAVCHAYDIEYAYESCIVGNMGIQYVMGLATYTPTTFWYQFRDVQDPFVEWLHDCVSLPNPPLVTAISSIVDEFEVDKSTLDQFNTLAQKYALQGGTIVVASGNNGANSQYSRCGYYPAFPASSAFVTTVGATMGPESGDPEVTCQSDLGGSITSGGGFSNKEYAPSYQLDQVSAYWALCGNGTLNGCVPVQSDYEPYNVTGRGYPDVSLAGNNYQVVVDGVNFLKSSTAASAVTFAAMVSLINANRMASGGSPLGFLNSVMYSTSTVFTTDITSGNNKCVEDIVTHNTSISQPCCDSGFNATTGWDPVTGLGSVDYSLFSTIFPTTTRRALRAHAPPNASSWIMLTSIRDYVYKLFFSLWLQM